MLFFTKKSPCLWEGALLAEREQQGNPERGWYYIHTYILEDSMEIAPPVRCGEETLALVLINIGGYHSCPLTPASILNLEEILEGFCRAGLDMILRICYDTQGRGPEREPGQLRLVQEHIRQLAPVLHKYEEGILLFQGLLVGSWGEMHGSKFLLQPYFSTLYRTIREAFGERIPLAFRQPLHYRLLFEEGERQGNIGFFNDAILASETCMGTYAPMARPKSAWREQWNFFEEMSFMREYAGEVPYGGEALWGGGALTPAETVENLMAGRVTYLNAAYDPVLLEKWKSTPYEEGDLYHYVGDHLGYRLVVQNARWEPARGGAFSLDIKNTGFGPFLTRARLFLQIEGEECAAGELVPLKEDLYGLEYGQSKSFHLALPADRLFQESSVGQVRISLVIKRVRDGKNILPAQAHNGASLFLGRVVRRR